MRQLKSLGIGMALTMMTAFTACQRQAYTVSGTIDGVADGDTLFLTNDMAALTPIDTAIVKDGKYELTGTADSTMMCAVYAMNRPDLYGIFFLEPGHIKLNIAQDDSQTTVSGTKANNAWQEVMTLNRQYGEQMQQLATVFEQEDATEEQTQEAMQQMQLLESQMTQHLVELASKNTDNELGFFLIVNLPESDELTHEKRHELISRMPAAYRQREPIKDIEALMDEAAQTAVGETIPDFTMSTPDGQELSVKQEIAQHKLTLLDFWASWCGPCRNEMPHMVSLYQQYQDKGLGIIGISLDEDADAWKQAIKELGITWPQISDLKGWHSAAAEMFHVSSIPHIIVVDADGTIVQKGLRGEILEQFVSEQLAIQ